MVQVRLRYSKEHLAQLAEDDSQKLDEILRNQDIGVSLRYMNSMGLSYRRMAEVWGCAFSAIAYWGRDETRPRNFVLALKISSLFNRFRQLEEQGPQASVNTDE